tara:strand:+ start:4613 stop:5281 length:669 start_codon:yes stop_codon:yes gene_type:complete
MGLMDFMGMGSANNYYNNMDTSGWNYDAAQSNYGGPNSYLTGAIGNLNANADYASSQGRQMLDPNSEYYNKQRGFLREGISQGINDTSRAQNRMMAARGMGGGGLRGLLGAVNANQTGEQVRQGMNTMVNNGMQQGTALLGMGTNAYGQVGQLGAGIDSNNLQQAMFNAGQTNSASQFNAQSARDYSMMGYNNAAARDANVAGLWGGAIGLAGSFLPIPKKP